MIVVHRVVWDWMEENGAQLRIKGVRVRAKGNKVRVEGKSYTLLETGVALSRILSKLGGKSIKGQLRGIQVTVATPMARLNNWNLLVAALKQLGITVKPQEKNQVVSGGMILNHNSPKPDLNPELLCSLSTPLTLAHLSLKP